MIELTANLRHVRKPYYESTSAGRKYEYMETSQSSPSLSDSERTSFLRSPLGCIIQSFDKYKASNEQEIQCIRSRILRVRQILIWRNDSSIIHTLCLISCVISCKRRMASHGHVSKLLYVTRNYWSDVAINIFINTT